MKDFRSTVMEAALQQLASSDPFIWLIEVRVPSDPPQRLRLTNYSTPISRGTDTGGHPLIWYPFPIAHGDMSEQVRGSLSDLTINVCNVTREIMDELELYQGLVDQPVVIRLVHSQGLNDPAAESRFDGNVVQTNVRDSVASFKIAATNVTKTLFPKNRLLAFDCGWVYGSSQCGYAIPAVCTNVVGGGFDFCGRTLDDCVERGEDEEARGLASRHPDRFGACPGIRLGA